MNPLTLNRQFRPRERLNTTGLMRPAVGGIAFDPANPPQIPAAERGFTYPLVITDQSVEIFPVDTDRRFLYIVNFDTLGVVWISFGGSEAVVNRGMRLAPGGGGILLDQNVPTARIFAVGTIASNANVSAVLA